MLEDDQHYDWRREKGMFSCNFYKRRFAFLPVRCSDNSLVFLKYYFKKYTKWNTVFNTNGTGHIDFSENVTSEEYVVRKLIEGH